MFFSKINGFDPYLYIFWLVASGEVSETLIKKGVVRWTSGVCHELQRKLSRPTFPHPLNCSHFQGEVFRSRLVTRSILGRFRLAHCTLE